MIMEKKKYPEEGDVVLCTVKNISYHSVFVTLDEYPGLEGMIHISEIAPGRIRNIRDYVKEGKKVVCKVLRANPERGQFELSYRRVSVAMRKNKNEETRMEQKAQKILEAFAEMTKKSVQEVNIEIGQKIKDAYGSLYVGFQTIVYEGEKAVNNLKLGENAKEFVKLVLERVKPKDVEVEGTIELQNSTESGLEKIKKAFEEGKKFAEERKYNISFAYVSAPRYRMVVKAEDYKTANDIIQEVAEAIIEFNKKNKGEGLFAIKEKKS